MYWQGAAALLLGASSHIIPAAAQVITITHANYASTCSAIYTSGSRSVTVVQSTITVSPVPWNDKIPNSGTPFVLQALPATGGTKKRQATTPRWVLPDGYLTTDGTKAAQYVIKNGQLTTVTGGWISTFDGISYGTFAVNPTVGDINTTFSVTDGQIAWTNSLFTNGAARLYQTPDGAQDPPRIVARFYGAINSAWTPYSLYARPVNAAVYGTSGMGGMSSTAIVSSMGDGMPSMQPPISASPYQTPNYSYKPTLGGQQGQGSQSSAPSNGDPLSSPGEQSTVASSGPVAQQSSSTAQSSPLAPSPSRPISPEGFCGGDSGLYCAANECCGQYGYCGLGPAYCGTGCQAGFGTCWSASTSSRVLTSSAASMPGVTSNPASSSSAESISISLSAFVPVSLQVTSSSTSSTRSYVPAPTYAKCPVDDGQMISDGYQQQYTIGCGKDTTVGSYASQTVSRGFNECFGLCDERPECVAFTYQGGVNGLGAGICYFKNAPVNFVTIQNGDRYVGAVKAKMPSDSSSGIASSTSNSPEYSTLTSPPTPIGPDNPDGPQSRPSSSSVMETDIFSLMSMSMSMTMFSSSAPSPTLPVSPNGHCGTQGNGGTPEGYSCTGSDFGPCCSLSGFCGFTPEYCLAGCQSDFGECTPQAGGLISENGECGMDWGNQTCTGGIFGRCCSKSGFCGSETDYCAPENCNADFGECDEASSSTMVMSTTLFPDYLSTTSSMMDMSTSMPDMTSSLPSESQMMASSTSSSAAADATTSLCPGADGTTYTDPSGTKYTVMCGRDFAPGSFKIVTAASFAACINICLGQTDQACIGVTFGGGQCYLKAEYDGSSSSSGMDSAVLVDIMPSSPSAYSSSSAGMMSSTSSTMAMMSTSSPSSSIMATSPTSTSIISSSSSSRAVSSFSSLSSAFASTATSSSSPSPSASSTRVSSTSSSSSRASSTSSSSSSSSAAVSSTKSSSSSSSSPMITTTTSTTGTTTTATSSTFSSTSSSPYLVLPSPTPCDFGDPVGYDEDDSYCRIDLPFSMRIYTQSNTSTFAATNGYLSISYGSSKYASQQYPTSNLPNSTVAPFFDDLFLAGKSSPKQGIFYQIQGTSVTYEWYLGRNGFVGRMYHFTVMYDSAVPGVFTYTYYATGGTDDQGLYASVGAQGKNAAGASVGSTYAYHVQSIALGLIVVCDTNQNTCVTAS